MRLLIILTVIPLTVMVLGIVAMIYNYSGSYNRIMANLKVINTYNMNFKSDMEYSMYRVMIGLINTKEFESRQHPINMQIVLDLQKKRYLKA